MAKAAFRLPFARTPMRRIGMRNPGLNPRKNPGFRFETGQD
jgi:hypothetical protein